MRGRGGLMRKGIFAALLRDVARQFPPLHAGGVRFFPDAAVNTPFSRHRISSHMGAFLSHMEVRRAADARRQERQSGNGGRFWGGF
jgi:hypothetical protein